ncbi:MAG: hypothetical protein Q7J69_06610 [Candidatus Omnitrophota bacterium]|nr:hypothetical protein [Candidatus Omnitrophota bacterium]
MLRALCALAMTVELLLAPLPSFAAELPAVSSDYILRMARVDLAVRKRDYTQAADELGRVPKEHQEDPLFRKYAEKVTSGLYSQKVRAAVGPGAAFAQRDTVTQRLRVTRHKKDSDARSDQNSDREGWQVNEHLESDVQGKDGSRARFTVDLDGFKNGHHDLRYRTLLADFYDGPSHFALGDSATYPSPYFLRGSRLRGVDMILSGELNEFQAVAGGYPFWLESRDEYIYPRTVLGARDRWKIFDDRIRLGAGFVNTRDNGKIRTIDTANNVRDNFVYSLDQEMKLIPDVWYLKTAQAYSTTDEDLNDYRFSDPTKLKDTSFKAETLLIQPWARWTSRFERTGPEFRLLVDLPSGGVLNQKTITADRQLFENFVDLEPLGPFDLDLQASFNRNDLDRDDNVEEIRQSWYSANLGIRMPKGWPRPRFRATMIDTVTVPGTQVRPAQSREVNLRSELSHTHEGIHFTEFAQYETDHPSEDKDQFSAEEKWSLGTRAATTLLERILVSPHYTYRFTDTTEVRFIDNVHRFQPVDAVNHEAGISTSTRLWSTSSLGLAYTFLHGKLTNTDGLFLTPTEGHSGTANFTWPYTRHSWNKRRKLTVFPALAAQFTDLSRPLEKRPLFSSQLSMAYEVMQNWKAELRGEFLFDHDTDGDQIRSEEHRFWMLWTSQWKGEPQWAAQERPREKLQAEPSKLQALLDDVRRRLRLESDLSVQSGYRTDDLDWNIAGDSNGQNPNILSELIWEDLESYQVSGTARLTARPFLSGRLSVDHGWIFDGKNQDSDYDGDNRTLEFSRSNNTSDDGSLLDLSGGIGIPLEPPSKGHALRLTPLVGYSYHEQNLRITHGFQTIPATGPFADLNSEYETQWRGPWLGADLEFKLLPKVRCFGGFEYHWTTYKADARWNLRTDFSQPKSFRHRAEGNGIVGSGGIGYLFSEHLSLELSAAYRDWTADENGVDRTFFSDGTSADTHLNEVNWESLAVSLGLRGRY